MMFRRVIQIICLVPFICALVAAAKKDSRIMNGQKITIDKAPYTVQLRYNSTGTFFCAGTLVDPTHVVTAAHCISRSSPNEAIVVVGGATTISEKGIQRLVVNNSSHPDFYQGANDVAVLELESALEGLNIETIDLCSTNVDDSSTFLQVSGWGRTEDGELSEDLRTVRVPTIPFETCEKQYKGLASTMMCASVTGRKDACQGDSGGPAIVNGELCGVVSWGKGCARFPGIYTNVRAVMPYLHTAFNITDLPNDVIRKVVHNDRLVFPKD